MIFTESARPRAQQCSAAGKATHGRQLRQPIVSAPGDGHTPSESSSRAKKKSDMAMVGLLLQADLLALAVERGLVDAEDFGGFHEVLGLGQHLPDVGFLQPLQ